MTHVYYVRSVTKKNVWGKIMQVGSYYLDVRETGGSIDHKYKCNLVDGLFDVGSGDTEYEAMQSCINVIVKQALELQKQFKEIKFNEVR